MGHSGQPRYANGVVYFGGGVDLFVCFFACFVGLLSLPGLRFVEGIQLPTGRKMKQGLNFPCLIVYLCFFFACFFR